MTQLDAIRLRRLLDEAKERTKNIKDAKTYLGEWHPTAWLAVRIMCEAMLGEEER